MRQQTDGGFGCQFHDARIGVVGVVQTSSPGIDGQQTGIDNHLSVGRRCAYDLRMNTIGVEHMVVLGEAVQVRHDLRGHNPVLQTLEQHNDQRSVELCRVLAVVELCHHGIVVRRERTIRLYVLDHQVVVGRDINRRIEHAGVRHRCGEMGAVNGFTMFANERQHFVFLLGIGCFLFVVDIDCFGADVQNNGSQQGT